MADGNNYGGNQNQTTRDRHALGDFRAHLLADVQPGAMKQPRLSVYYHKNKMVMEVRTNVPSDMDGRERGVIRAEMDPTTFFCFLAMLAETIKNPPAPRPEGIKVLRPDFQKNNGGEPVMEAQIVVGKNAEGVVYMSLLSANKDRPRIMFPFHPGKFVQFIGNDGNPKTNAQISEVYANAKLIEWEGLVPQYLYDRFVAEEFKRDGQQGGQGGGGGGYQRGGGGGGGYQQRNNNNNQGGSNNSGGGDMRTEARAEETQSWDNLPF